MAAPSPMPSRTYKLIQLVGISDRSFADAAKNAVNKASETLQGLAWFEVVEERGRIDERGRIQYQVKLDVAFRLMSANELGEAGPAKKKR